MKLGYRLLAIVVAIVSCAFASAAVAGVRAVVDKSDQQMLVYQDGALLYTWDVSTGVQWSWTPAGTFSPTWLDRHHRSHKYGNAPMPWSVFFNGGIAVHGTVPSNYGLLGQQASHGCVRLHQDNAKIFFDLVKSVGMSNTIIVVQS
jgi:lipoprotein-anchoring transpeptidase ErfK/SrfK